MGKEGQPNHEVNRNIARSPTEKTHRMGILKAADIFGGAATIATLNAIHTEETRNAAAGVFLVWFVGNAVLTIVNSRSEAAPR